MIHNELRERLTFKLPDSLNKSTQQFCNRIELVVASLLLEDCLVVGSKLRRFRSCDLTWVDQPASINPPRYSPRYPPQYPPQSTHLTMRKRCRCRPSCYKWLELPSRKKHYQKANESTMLPSDYGSNTESSNDNKDFGLDGMFSVYI